MFYTAKSRIRFKKVNGDTITPYIEICANKSSNQQIHYEVVINGKTIPAMIDLGATSNFMCTRTREWDEVITQKKRKPYRLGLVDGSHTSSKSGWVTTETEPLLMEIDDHTE